MIKPFASIIAVAFISCSGNKTPAPVTDTVPPADVFHVKTVPVQSMAVTDTIQVTGMIQSDAEAKPSFKTGGIIARMYAKEGDHVKKGQLLAQLNMTEIEAQASQAEKALDKALRDLQRIENLHNDSIATLEQYQNATTAVEIARKTVEIARFNAAWSEVRSPIDGNVVSQLLHEGEITGPGIPVYYIIGVAPKDWKIIAGLTDKNWGRIKAGDKVLISLDAYPEWSTEGRVRRLSDVANPMTGTFDAEISVPSKDKRLAAGMLARLAIEPSASAGFPVIPIEALVSSNGRSGIVYVPKDGKAEKRTIQIQAFYGEKISVLSGLDGVTEVITAGSGFLEDGDGIIVQ